MNRNTFDKLSPDEKRQYLGWVAENAARGTLKNAKTPKIKPGQEGKTKRPWFQFN